MQGDTSPFDAEQDVNESPLETKESCSGTKDELLQDEKQSIQ
jgi:hypothetical protein